MAREKLPPLSTPEEIFQVLKGEDYNTALSLHELGKSLGCKIEAKTGARSYKVVYSLTKPKKRALFTIECNAVEWQVKANLFRIGFYEPQVEGGPDKIKQSIKDTRACVECNPGCKGRASYVIDGETLLPCYGSGHYIKGLGADEWEYLEELIVLESKV